MEKLQEVMNLLIDETTLPQKYQDHELSGEWQGFRECHIEGNWLLIYKIEVDTENQETIIFVALDSHANLFS